MGMNTVEMYLRAQEKTKDGDKMTKTYDEDVTVPSGRSLLWFCYRDMVS